LFAELKALVALAETGSMERAANDLYLTPSALTRRIQRLEIELGVVLLDRHFQNLRSLTQAGFEVLREEPRDSFVSNRFEGFHIWDDSPDRAFSSGSLLMLWRNQKYLRSLSN